MYIFETDLNNAVIGTSEGPQQSPELNNYPVSDI